MIQYFTLSLFSALIVFLAAIPYLFFKEKTEKKQFVLILGLASSIAGFAAVISIFISLYYVFLYGFIFIFVVPIHVAGTFLGVFPLVWAIILLFTIVFNKSSSFSKYSISSRVAALIILMLYMGTGYSLWEQHSQDNYAYHIFYPGKEHIAIAGSDRGPLFAVDSNV